MKKRRFINQSRPLGDILTSGRFWILHSVTLPAVFCAGWLFVSTGLVYDIFGTPRPNSYFFDPNLFTFFESIICKTGEVGAGAHLVWPLNLYWFSHFDTFFSIGLSFLLSVFLISFFCFSNSLDIAFNLISTLTLSCVSYSWLSCIFFFGLIVFSSTTVADIIPWSLFGFSFIVNPASDISIDCFFGLVLLGLQIGLLAAHPNWFRRFSKFPLFLTPFAILELIVLPLSLILRLFGTILVGDVLFKTCAHICPVLFPAISLFLSLFVGCVQASVVIIIFGQILAISFEDLGFS